MIWKDPAQWLPETGSDGYSRRVLIRVLYKHNLVSAPVEPLVEFHTARLQLPEAGRMFFEICSDSSFVFFDEVTHWADITDPITGATVI